MVLTNMNYYSCRFMFLLLLLLASLVREDLFSFMCLGVKIKVMQKKQILWFYKEKNFFFSSLTVKRTKKKTAFSIAQVKKTPLPRTLHHASQPVITNYKHKRLRWIYLRLKTSYDFLASLHDRVQFAGDHDGQALVFGQGQLDVGPRPLHDVQAHFGLLALTELAVVLVATLLKGHVEHLRIDTLTG